MPHTTRQIRSGQQPSRVCNQEADVECFVVCSDFWRFHPIFDAVALLRRSARGRPTFVLARDQVQGALAVLLGAPPTLTAATIRAGREIAVAATGRLEEGL